ncbi:hypothetical protein NKDENANG_04068 [Candidatus Entotheonellaceae bacterium PAL068K]
MSAILPYLLTAIILFVSTLARATLGFGDALVAMPLLVLALGIRTAAPLVALVATTIALLIAWRHWHRVDLMATARLVLASCLGIPLGLVFVKDISASLMHAVLGGLIIAFSVYSLAQPQFDMRQDRGRMAYVFGFLAGVLGGAYNTVGPPIVVYGHLRRWSPDRFRATLQGYFFPVYLCIVIGHGFIGLLTPYVFQLYGLSFPVVLAAICLGGRLNATIPREQFTRVLNVALIGLGLGLCLRAF